MPPAVRRPARLVARVLAAAVLAVLLAGAVIGVEVMLAQRRDYVAAESAPPVQGEFGSPGARQLRVTVFGDSTAAGLGVSTTADTVGGQVATQLAADGYRVLLSSVAVSGSRVADLAGQIDRALGAGPPPDVALVLIGANDATHRSDLDRVREQQRRAVERLRSAGAEVVVGTCPDLGAALAFAQPLRLLAGWQGRRVAAVQAPAIRAAGGLPVDLARRTGPAFRADPATLSSDEFHPSARGYRLWAQALLPEVRAAAVR